MCEKPFFIETKRLTMVPLTLKELELYLQHYQTFCQKKEQHTIHTVIGKERFYEIRHQRSLFDLYVK